MSFPTLIIGYGNIGKTFAEFLQRSSLLASQDLHVLLKEKHALPESQNTLQFHHHIGEYISDFSLIILAVKPQDFDALSHQIQPYLNPNTLVLSVMAGISMASISQKLGIGKIIRSMPNLPSQIGQGMSVYTATDSLSKKELSLIQNLLNSIGKSLYVEEEKMLDAATAISGSGPAYVFYFIQSMTEAAKALGFNPSEAQTLVSQTLMGSVSLLNASGISPQEWISKVASKGGTTEAALAVLEKQKFSQILNDAITAAEERARLLGS